MNGSFLLKSSYALKLQIKGEFFIINGIFNGVDGTDGKSVSEAMITGDDQGLLSEGSMPPTVMPFTAVEHVEDGKALLGFSNLRRVGEWGRTNVVSQSRSDDGGLTWGFKRINLVNQFNNQ